MNLYQVEYFTALRARLAQEKLEREYAVQVTLFVLLHVILALLMRWQPVLAAAHGLLALGLGLLWLISGEQPERVVTVLAYIAGAELLWRVVDAPLFWEYGKYTVILLLCLALLKYPVRQPQDKWGLIYFILLLPSLFMMPRFDREAIAFNLAGPFALAMSATFFSGQILEKGTLKGIFIALMAPVAGLLALTTYETLSVETIAFTGDSITATAAGFGPNQVSSILGMGALAAFWMILLNPKGKYLRLLMIMLATGFMAQAALTFSRGGVYTAVLSMLAAGLYLLRDHRHRWPLLLGSALMLLVSYLAVFPALDRFTGQELGARLIDLNPTGRDLIIQADWITFRQHPLFGVGPGQSEIYHALTFRFSSAHTEYSRMLAEHGLFGLLALLMLLGIILKPLRSNYPPEEKAWRLSLVVWALLFMFHSATRLVAPSFLFGLALAVCKENGSDKAIKENSSSFHLDY